MQYVIAETTASARLRSSARKADEDGLIICGLVSPHAQGVLSYVLQVVSDSLAEIHPGSEAHWSLPVNVVQNVQADTRFAANRISGAFPDVRFYAAVPIRSPSGPFIGVLSLISDTSRKILSNAGADGLRNVSLTAMDYLMMIHRRHKKAQQENDAWPG